MHDSAKLPAAPAIRTVPELLSAAVDFSNSIDGEEGWIAVTALQRLGSAEVLNGALAFCRSSDPRERARGLAILGQLGLPARTHAGTCIATAIAALENDRDPAVLSSAAIALMHLGLGVGTSALIEHAAHPDREVRRSVAMALGGNAAPEAILALIGLSSDGEADVRDWATTGLGAFGTADTPEIREALFARLADDDGTVRFEALCGLARVGDRRITERLIAAIAAHPEDKDLWEPASLLLGLDRADEATMNISAQELLTKLAALVQEP